MEVIEGWGESKNVSGEGTIKVHFASREMFLMVRIIE